MTGLPKFVRDQMGRSPAPPSHPDADLLTAFSENALSGKERQQIVEHLTACSDCREIIFLSQPETVETQTVLAPKTRRFTWMAWTSVAAVVVVVASAVIIQREQITKIQPPVTVATTTTPLPAETKSADSSNEFAYAAPTAGEKDREDKDRKKEMAARASDMKALKPKAAPESLVTSKTTAADESFAVLPRSIPPPAPSAPGLNQNAIVGETISQQKATGPEQRNVSGQLQQQAQVSSNQPQGPSNSANANSANLANMNDNLARAEAAPAAKVQKKQARVDSLRAGVTGYAVGAPLTQPAARAHWQISSTGALERSYIADQWTPVLAETGAKFHVVSVIGNTIWAGGENGALYTSRDGGSTWTPVKVDTAETITSIHFSDDSHGTLQTSNGLTWKTSDGGKTWEKP
jgi:putative zinc finger protein